MTSGDIGALSRSRERAGVRASRTLRLSQPNEPAILKLPRIEQIESRPMTRIPQLRLRSQLASAS